MDKSELLYDHYKETNYLRLDAQKRRNRNFLICCVLEALSFFFIIQKKNAMSIFQELIKEKYGIVTQIGNNTIQTLLWILIAYFLILYIQNTLYIERQYDYQYLLENEIQREIKVFSREGKLYQKDYPNSLNLIDIFYKVLCPLIFGAINVYRIVKEWRACESVYPIIIDSILFGAVFIIMWAFFFDIHNGLSNWCRDKIPGFRKIADWIRKQLEKI